MSNRIWLGLIFLLIGLGFFLHEADMINLPYLLFNWWPLLFIIIGVFYLLERTKGTTLTGFLFVIVGVLLLANQWFELNLIAHLWPLLFIVIGLIFIFTRSKGGKSTHVDNKLNTFVLLSGAEVRSQSNPFQGGSVTSVLGGAEVDLRDAIIPDGTTLDLTSVLGGIDIKVSENVQVELSGVPLLGGWEDNTRISANEEEVTVLKMNCITILGGVQITN